MELNNKPSGGPKYLILYGLAALALCALFLIALTRFHEDLSHPGVEHLDQAVLQRLHNHNTPTRTALARILSFIGSPLTLFPTIPIASAILWVRGRHHNAILLLVGMAGAGTLESIIKLHFRRTRPDVPWAFVHERSFSFPSGHSVLAVVLYGTLAYILLQTLRRNAWRAAYAAGIIATSLTLIIGIGLSRIYLGAHYPSDVAAGYFIGSVWLLVVITTDILQRRSLARIAVPPDTPGTGTASERPDAPPAR